MPEPWRYIVNDGDEVDVLIPFAGTTETVRLLPGSVLILDGPPGTGPVRRIDDNQ